MKKIITYILFSFLGIFTIAEAQNDTIISKDNNILVGEIKEMDRGILTIETSYSDDDFKITWLELKEIISTRKYRFSLSNGDRLHGTIKVDTIDKKLIINDDKRGAISISPEELVFLKHVDDGSIFDIMNLSMDVGYSFTKTNNLHQLNGSFNADYYVQKWGVSANANTVQNVQDNAPSTRRSTGGLEFRLFMKNDFFALASGNYLSNNEQQLDLRSTYSVGIGKYLIHTNRIYFNASAGVAYTIENFMDTIPDKNGTEGQLGVEYNMFDIGDLNLFTKLVVNPSFTEKGRVRTLFNIKVKYDLPRDFYLKTSLDYHYDNKPLEGVDPEDYVFTFGFGWEL